jgi:hypothetical protein
MYISPLSSRSSARPPHPLTAIVLVSGCELQNLKNCNTSAATDFIAWSLRSKAERRSVHPSEFNARSQTALLIVRIRVDDLEMHTR